MPLTHCFNERVDLCLADLEIFNDKMNNFSCIVVLCLILTLAQNIAPETYPVLPNTKGLVTLKPGEPIKLKCENNASWQVFFWYYIPIDDDIDYRITSNQVENVQVMHDTLILHKPTVEQAGNYICRLRLEDYPENTVHGESFQFKVRMQPYIEDFSSETSHSGESKIVYLGERLELNCNVVVEFRRGNLTITWSRSTNPNSLEKLTELPSSRWQDRNITIETISNRRKRLVIKSVGYEHRGYYVCEADNQVAEKGRKVLYIRVKDVYSWLWPLFGIMSELFILFLCIYLWRMRQDFKDVC